MTLTAAQLALQAANAGVQKLTTASNSAAIKAAKTKLAAAVVPFVADTPAPPPDPTPVTESPDGARVGGPADPSIVDAKGNTFGLNASKQVVVNGAADTTTNTVDWLLYKGHVLYQTAWGNWWSWAADGWHSASDPNGSTPTPPNPPPTPSSKGPTIYLGGTWNEDPSRTWDFTKMADGAALPDKLYAARFARAGLDYDYGASTANSQIDSRQTAIKGGALRMGIGLADASANANASKGGYSWKYVAGCINGKGGLFLANNEVLEVDAVFANWARGRWDAIWWIGLDANGNEVWPPEYDLAETDNSWGSANVTNTTDNWHDGYGQASSQTGPLAWAPPIDVTQAHTYSTARIGNVFQPWGDGVRRGPDGHTMDGNQAALRWYPVIGASVRSGFNSVPTGDAIVITGIRTFVKG